MNEQKNIIRRQIDRYIAGELNTEEIDQLWSDLLDYPELVDELKVQATLKSLYKEDNTSSVQEQSYSYISTLKFYKWILPAAAVLLITVGLGIYSLLSTEQKPEAIESISIAELRSPDVQRSGEDEYLTGTDSLLHAGYNAAVNNDIQPAISYFQQAADADLDTNSEVQARHNLGILYYNDRDFEQAAYLFNKTIESASDRSLISQTQWYLANTYIQLGKYSDAYEQLLIVHESNSDHKQEAGELLRTIEPHLSSDPG